MSRITANLCHKTDLQHLSGQAQRQSQGGAQSDLYFQTSPDSKGGASVASSISEFRNHDCVRVPVFSGGRGCTQREPLQAEKEMLRIQLQEEFVPVPGTAPKKSEPPSPPPCFDRCGARQHLSTLHRSRPRLPGGGPLGMVWGSSCSSRIPARGYYGSPKVPGHVTQALIARTPPSLKAAFAFTEEAATFGRKTVPQTSADSADQHGLPSGACTAHPESHDLKLRGMSTFDQIKDFAAKLPPPEYPQPERCVVDNLSRPGPGQYKEKACW